MRNPFKMVGEALGQKPKDEPKPVSSHQSEMDLLEMYKSKQIEKDPERLKRAKELARDKLKKKRGATNYPEERID